MHSAILPLVHAITADRSREAAAARLASSVPKERSQPRPRRIRLLADRLAFSR